MLGQRAGGYKFLCLSGDSDVYRHSDLRLASQGDIAKHMGKPRPFMVS